MSHQEVATAIYRPRRMLYPMTVNDSNPEGVSMLVQISKEIAPGEAGRSAQSSMTGTREHPFDFLALKNFKDYNEFHATCISAKISATVGLGHLNESDKARREYVPRVDPITGTPSQEPRAKPWEESKADTVLNPLCSISWADTLNDVAEDFWDTGNGYLEVVRQAGTIKGIHHLPSPTVKIVVENNQHDFHYEIQGESGAMNLKFAAFGDREDLIRRLGIEGEAADRVSEIIHFCQPSSRVRWYGAPDWISAVPIIEMTQMLHQHRFDFYNNRGVPEMMVIVKGAQLDTETKKQLQDAMKATIGLGNSHKSLLINIPQQEAEIQVEKLAMEGTNNEEGFKAEKETLGLSVVTAHKVPPLLAGIQVPGKLGATNEMSQALIAFQALVIGRAQRIFMTTLGRTLGLAESGLGLTPEDFALKTIVEDIDIEKLSTVGRMRQPLPQAQREGRNLDKGVKK
jgi:hypothetical protein